MDPRNVCLLLLASLVCSFGCEDKYTPGDQDAAVDGAVARDAALDAAPTDSGPSPDAAPSEDAGHTGDGGVGCSDSDECGPTAYCEKPACGAPTGHCKTLPTTCPEYGTPVCGCDGVIYWNDCYRQKEGATAAHTGECDPGEAATCGGLAGLPCAHAGAFCAYLFDASGWCGMMDPMGVCWITPPACSMVTIGGDWRPCWDQEGICKTRCEAIQTGSYYFQDNTCPQ